jgi:hypothetical protein
MVWRDALGDDEELGPMAKVVALTLANHADAKTLDCWPSMVRLARRASVSERTANKAVRHLDQDHAGFVHVDRSESRRGNYYVLTLPVTANDLRRSEWERANEVRRSTGRNGERHAQNGERHAQNGERQVQNGERQVQNGERGALESTESAESVAAMRSADAIASHAIEEPCARCGETFTTTTLSEDTLCTECRSKENFASVTEAA